MWLVRYLIGTNNMGICYSRIGSKEMTGYVDADHASHESRYSIFCYIFMYGGAPIFWKSGFEERFLLSTSEFEIRAVYGLCNLTRGVFIVNNINIIKMKSIMP